MTTLITGGNGVIGIQVARILAEGGEDVISYARSGAPFAPDLILGDATARVRFVDGDVCDVERLRETVEQFGVDGIVHVAGLTGEALAKAQPQDVFAVNVGGTMNVLEVARRANLRRVVYIGSSSEYGRRPDLRPVAEGEENVEGLYAETKHLGHRLGQRYHAVFGLDVITARVGSVYGPNISFKPLRGLVGHPLIGHLTRAAALGEQVRLEGGGDYSRGWSYAADTAHGICLAYWAGSPKHRLYNIASGRSYTTAEVVEAIRRIEPTADIVVGPGKWEDNPFQAGNLRGPLDISRAREDLGFEPKHTLEDGLRAYIDWWRRRAARVGA